jgi:hypothetical protein
MATIWFGFAAFTGRALLSGATVLLALAAALAGTVMARGAWDLPPFRGYSGTFIVVGDFSTQGAAVPMRNAVGPPGAVYAQGEYVTVECKTHGSDHPKDVWYRLKAPHVYIPETDLVASIADPPGVPPWC